MKQRDPSLEVLLSRRGAVKAISARLGISTAAVSQWKRVPTRHVSEVAAALGVSPKDVEAAAGLTAQ